MSFVSGGASLFSTAASPFPKTAGGSIDCQADFDFNSVASVNATRLGTCQPLEISVFGGPKPYTLTIAALDSSMTTNVTLPSLDDTYTFRYSGNASFIGELYHRDTVNR